MNLARTNCLGSGKSFMTPKRILVTGAAGFIGSAVARRIIEATPHEVLVYDKLTYAGNLASLAPIEANARYRFLQADICDPVAARDAFETFKPDWVMHLAAESHVDRSIDGPGEFIQTNVVGTASCCRRRSPIGAAWKSPEGGGFPLPPHLDRRSVRFARRRGPVPRGHALCAELALFGLEGRLRPSRARLASHLRPADVRPIAPTITGLIISPKS